MNETTMQVMLEMKNSASPQLAAFGEQVKATSATVNTSGVQMQQSMGGIGQTVMQNQQAFSDLAMGVNYLGTTFLGLGVAMQMSNDETLKAAGNTMMMVGAIMTAVGSASQFVYAISKMVQALKALRVQQILTQAFSGPKGWIALGVGAAVAGGAIYGVSKMESGATRTAQPKFAATIENKVYLDSKQIGAAARKDIVLQQQRNNTSGVR